MLKVWGMKHRSPFRLLCAVLATGALMVFTPSAWAQCAACKEALTSGVGSMGWGAGFNLSVFVMLGTFFFLAAAVVGVIVREAMRSKPPGPTGS